MESSLTWNPITTTFCFWKLYDQYVEQSFAVDFQSSLQVFLQSTISKLKPVTMAAVAENFQLPSGRVLVPETISFSWLAAMCVVNFSIFYLAERLARKYYLPLPDWANYDKRTFAFFVWSQVVTITWCVLGYQIYTDPWSNSEEFHAEWENRIYTEIPGGALLGHVHVSYQLTLFAVIFLYRPSGQDSIDMIAHHAAALVRFFIIYYRHSIRVQNYFATFFSQCAPFSFS